MELDLLPALAAVCFGPFWAVMSIMAFIVFAGVVGTMTQPRIKDITPPRPPR